MKKTSLFITEHQWKKMEEVTQKGGLSFGELVRRMIDEYLEKNKEGK